MVLGYHLIMGTYGFWLANDPRGSWSDFVGSRELFHYGPATKTEERVSLARRAHDASLRKAAKQALQRPPVHFTGLQARSVGMGFGNSIRGGRLMVWACSILPDHVHLVIARGRYTIEIIANLLKGAATKQLVADGLHPFQHLLNEHGRVPHCWVRGHWKVYLNSLEDILRAIAYVESNPLKEGKRKQRWSFVTPFDPHLV